MAEVPAVVWAGMLGLMMAGAAGAYRLSDVYRRQLLLALARRLGMSLIEHDRAIAGSWLMRLPLLADGPGGIGPVVRGRYRNQPVLIFDYLRGPRGAERVTVVAFRLQRSRLATFCLWPRSFSPIDELARRLDHGESVDIDGAPDLDLQATHLLWSANAKATRALMTAARAGRFTQAPGWAVEAGGEWILLYDTQHLLPHDLNRHLWEAFQQFRQLGLK